MATSAKLSQWFVLRRKTVLMYFAVVFVFSTFLLLRDMVILVSQSKVRYRQNYSSNSLGATDVNEGVILVGLSTTIAQHQPTESFVTDHGYTITEQKVPKHIRRVESRRPTIYRRYTRPIYKARFRQRPNVIAKQQPPTSQVDRAPVPVMCCRNSSLVSKINFRALSQTAGYTYKIWRDVDDGKEYRVPCEHTGDPSAIWEALGSLLDPGGSHRNDSYSKKVKRWDSIMNLERKLADIPSSYGYLCHIIDSCEKESQHLGHHVDRARMCSCLPGGLRGRLAISQERLLNKSWAGLQGQMPMLDSGGHWAPRTCLPRRRVAVIVPFRDRENHLRAFLAHLHPILQRQMVEYRIFIVEQNLPPLFNKAAMMNAGYLEAKRLFNPDCVLFHDVDTLIEHDDNMVMCRDKPIHWAAYNPRRDYRLDYKLFGAAVLLSSVMFEAVNGYTNLFFGWGAEDDILRRRLFQKKFRIYRPPLDVGRCQIIEHERDGLFRINADDKERKYVLFRQMMVDPFWIEIDGLSTVKYDVITLKEFPTHTWIHLDVTGLAVDAKAPTAYHEWAREMTVLGFNKSVQNNYATKPQCTAIIDNTPHYMSRITCKFKCDNDPICAGFDYHVDVEHEHDSYCIFRRATPCEDTKNNTDLVEMYSKLTKGIV